MSNDQPATNGHVPKGMPQPLSWIAGFINKNFAKMPQLIQIIVFLAFVIYFMFATLTLLWPMMFPPEFIEIRGDVIGADCAPLPDSLVKIEFSGEGLFVYKRPVGLGDKFTYEWILKTPRTKKDEKLWLALTMYHPELKRPIILASEAFSAGELLTQTDDDGKVHLQIDNPVTSIELTTCEKIQSSSENVSSFSLVNSAFALPQQTKQRQIHPDSVDLMIKNYSRFLNPVAQLQIIDRFSAADSVTTIHVAEKLKTAVVTGNNADISMYAPLLAGNRNLEVIFTDSTIFDSLFYEKALTIITSGATYNSRNMVNLLRRLNDPASIDHVFRYYSNTDNQKKRVMLVSILDGFRNSSDRKIRQKIVTWLEEKQRADNSSAVERSINNLLQKLRRR